MSRVWMKGLSDKGQTQLNSIRRDVLRYAVVDNRASGRFNRPIDGKTYLIMYRALPDVEGLQQVQLVVLSEDLTFYFGSNDYVTESRFLIRLALGEVKPLHKETLRHSLVSVEVAA